jgi:membrane associated rhomboid family serine protease
MARGLLNQIVFLLVINLAITFSWGGISWQAHIGGLIGGAATMAGLSLAGRRDPRGRLDSTDYAVMAVMALLIVAITWWRVATFSLL